MELLNVKIYDKNEDPTIVKGQLFTEAKSSLIVKQINDTEAKLFITDNDGYVVDVVDNDKLPLNFRENFEQEINGLSEKYVKYAKYVSDLNENLKIGIDFHEEGFVISRYNETKNKVEQTLYCYNGDIKKREISPQEGGSISSEYFFTEYVKQPKNIDWNTDIINKPDINIQHGRNGKNVFVRYSRVADGSNFVEQPTRDTGFIGICNTDDETAPTDKTRYTWINLVPSVNGEPLRYIRLLNENDNLNDIRTPGIYSVNISAYVKTSKNYPFNKLRGGVLFVYPVQNITVASPEIIIQHFISTGNDLNNPNNHFFSIVREFTRSFVGTIWGHWQEANFRPELLTMSESVIGSESVIDYHAPMGKYIISKETTNITVNVNRNDRRQVTTYIKGNTGNITFVKNRGITEFHATKTVLDGEPGQIAILIVDGAKAWLTIPNIGNENNSPQLYDVSKINDVTYNKDLPEGIYYFEQNGNMLLHVYDGKDENGYVTKIQELSRNNNNFTEYRKIVKNSSGNYRFISNNFSKPLDANSLTGKTFNQYKTNPTATELNELVDNGIYTIDNYVIPDLKVNVFPTNGIILNLTGNDNTRQQIFYESPSNLTYIRKYDKTRNAWGMWFLDIIKSYLSENLFSRSNEFQRGSVSSSSLLNQVTITPEGYLQVNTTGLSYHVNFATAFLSTVQRNNFLNEVKEGDIVRFTFWVKKLTGFTGNLSLYISRAFGYIDFLGGTANELSEEKFLPVTVTVVWKNVNDRKDHENLQPHIGYHTTNGPIQVSNIKVEKIGYLGKSDLKQYDELWFESFPNAGQGGSVLSGDNGIDTNVDRTTGVYSQGSEMMVNFKGTGSLSHLQLKKHYGNNERLKVRTRIDNNRFSGDWKEVAWLSDIPSIPSLQNQPISNIRFTGGSQTFVDGNGAYQGLGKRQLTTLDLKALDENKWYLVTCQLPNHSKHNIIVQVALNSGRRPSYASHDGGFSVYYEFECFSSGWGTQQHSLIRNIQYGQSWLNPSERNYPLVTSTGQLVNSSTQYFYIRGGSNYEIYADDYRGSILTFTLHTTEGEYEARNQRVKKIISNKQEVLSLYPYTQYSDIIQNPSKALLDSTFIGNQVEYYIINNYSVPDLHGKYSYAENYGVLIKYTIPGPNTENFRIIEVYYPRTENNIYKRMYSNSRWWEWQSTINDKLAINITSNTNLDVTHIGKVLQFNNTGNITLNITNLPVGATLSGVKNSGNGNVTIVGTTAPATDNVLNNVVNSSFSLIKNATGTSNLLINNK